MSKTLDTTGIANELSGASAFFAPAKKVARKRPAAKTPPQKKAAEGFSEKEKSALTAPVERTIEPTHQTTNGPTVERRNEQTLQRTKVRHTFDVFADQVTALKRIQLEREETLQKRYRLGDLVQEALDILITKERNHK